MKIINDAILFEFKSKERCEHCGAHVRTGLDPDHCFTRGSGRLDVRCNLIALCRSCHVSRHYGNEPTQATILAIIAARENVLQDDIRDVVYLLRRMDKGATDDEILRLSLRFSSRGRELLKRTLDER